MNFLILNSTTQLKKGIDFLKKHDTIYCFLDNDNEGTKQTNAILKLFPHKAIDKRNIYENHNDLNDYLMTKNKAVSC